MTLRPLACALALALLAGLASPASDAQKRRSSKAKVEPPSPACTDFYSHANAGWLQANPLPPGAGSISALEQLDDRSREQQVALLNTAMQSPQNPVQTLLGDFWASGLDLPGVEADGANPIAPLLQRVDAIKRTTHVAPAIAALHQVGIPVAFNFGADVDLQDLGRHIGYLTQGGLGLPDPAFYTRTDPDTRALLEQYTAYVQKILALTGVPQKQLAAQARQVIDLESRLAQASRPLSLLRDPRGAYAPVAVAGLDAQYPNLKLGEFLEAQGVTPGEAGGDVISIANPALVAQLDALVKELKPDQWRAYLRWRIGDSMAPYLAKAWRDAHFDFRGRVLAGETAPAPRQQQVLDAINLAAAPMLGREYVARYAPQATQARAQQVAEGVRDALGAALQRDTRLSPQARAEAQAKLAALRIEIGAPSRDLDYTVQPMGRGSFGGNMLIASSWHHREEMRRIGSATADRRWNVSPQQPALAYDIAQNRLIVTAAMLQEPVLDVSGSQPAQYGAFGALVGHELNHGFDNRGRMVDASGQLRDWWTPVDSAAWEATANRVAAQYGNYDYPGLTGLKVSGSRTRDESVADLAGVELAWAAYQAAVPESDPASRQAFYEGWARLWPQHMSPQAATLRAASGVHAPGQWRTNGPLINRPDFGEAFGCKPGTPMQSETDQQVAIWR